MAFIGNTNGSARSVDSDGNCCSSRTSKHPASVVEMQIASPAGLVRLTEIPHSREGSCEPLRGLPRRPVILGAADLYAVDRSATDYDCTPTRPVDQGVADRIAARDSDPGEDRQGYDSPTFYDHPGTGHCVRGAEYKGKKTFVPKTDVQPADCAVACRDACRDNHLAGDLS